MPPRGIDDTGRNRVNAKRPEFGGKNWNECGHGGVRGSNARGSRHGGVCRYRRDEGNAAIFAQKRKRRLSCGKVRIHLLLEALAHIGQVDRGERSSAFAAAKG